MGAIAGGGTAIGAAGNLVRPARGARGFRTWIGDLFSSAFAMEIEHRRPFLWIAPAAGFGVILYLSADREPSLWLAALLCAGFSALARLARDRGGAFILLVGGAAISAGFLSAGLRTLRVAAPVLDRVRIVSLTGTVEQMDFRRSGARFIIRVHSAEGLAPDVTPRRVRLTVRRAPPFEAGAFVRLKARLMPPARSALPGGYDFARDAYFSGIGAVGSTLGRIEIAVPPPESSGLWDRVAARIDRGRNALAARVDGIVGGDAGAVAAAMVTGKRDLLTEGTKELIREAGIFHIITISGVQMTLVAGLLFGGIRRLLALSESVALRFPIKKWSACIAMIGAVAYDIGTGSRVGTERALFMTLIMLGAVLVDRRALTMRNLAYAALCVILIEPEAILGASFQLSFAAVAALVAVFEARMSAQAAVREGAFGGLAPAPAKSILGRAAAKVVQGPKHVLLATLCATAATASFMAFNFHELSPYVLIGNPLTLAIIELFAVPGALVGTLLYPLGLDAWVWHYVGAGITLVLWAAKLLAAAPNSTIHLATFAPWSIGLLTLAVLSAVIWRTLALRLTAIPFAMLGLIGAASGQRPDVFIAASGEAAAVRASDGALRIIGRRPSVVASEQWLRADGDGRDVAEAARPERDGAPRCDRLGCVATLADGRALSIVLQPPGFEEDCARAAIVVTPLAAPSTCAAELILDRSRLDQTGAVGLIFEGDRIAIRTARSAMEDRPWSPAPRVRMRFAKKTTMPPATSSRDGDRVDRGDDQDQIFSPALD